MVKKLFLFMSAALTWAALSLPSFADVYLTPEETALERFMSNQTVAGILALVIAVAAFAVMFLIGRKYGNK